VAPGLVVATSMYPNGAADVFVGTRHRYVLRSLRDPGFALDHFDG
jgi:hypothetical protein